VIYSQLDNFSDEDKQEYSDEITAFKKNFELETKLRKKYKIHMKSYNVYDKLEYIDTHSYR